MRIVNVQNCCYTGSKHVLTFSTVYWPCASPFHKTRKTFRSYNAAESPISPNMTAKYAIISLVEDCLRDRFNYCPCSDAIHTLVPTAKPNKVCYRHQEIIIDQETAAFAIVHLHAAEANVKAGVQLDPANKASEKFLEWWKKGMLDGYEIDVREIVARGIMVSRPPFVLAGLRC